MSCCAAIARVCRPGAPQPDVPASAQQLAPLSPRLSGVDLVTPTTSNPLVQGKVLPFEVQNITMSVPDPDGAIRSHEVATHVYRPPGPGPHPVVIFAHGYPPLKAINGQLRADLAALQTPVRPVHAQHWVSRGYAVVAPLRPGYGPRGGFHREGGVVNTAQGLHLNPQLRARMAGDVIAKTAGWVAAQPWANTQQILLVGHSTGGITSLDVAARGIAGVVGVVNFAGCIGNPRTPDRWEPERLAELCGDYGARVAVPSLWIYASGDAFTAPLAHEDGTHELFERFRAQTSVHHDVTTVEVTCGPGESAHGALLTHPEVWEQQVDQFLVRVQPMGR